MGRSSTWRGCRRSRCAPSCEQVAGPVVLFFGLLRPYKGRRRAAARRGAGCQRRRAVDRGTPADRCRAAAGAARRPAVRFVSRFVADAELPALLPPRRRRRAPVLADRALRPVRRAGDRAGVRQADGAQRRGRLRRGRRDRRRRCWCRPAISVRWPPRFVGLLADEADRRRGSRGRRAAAAAGPYSWDEAARRTLELYRGLTGPRDGGCATIGAVVTALAIVFWISAGLVLYAHAGYFLLLWVVDRPRPGRRSAARGAEIGELPVGVGDRRRLCRGRGDRAAASPTCARSTIRRACSR